MFFIITNKVLNKRHPKIINQIIVAMIIYLISFIAIYEMASDDFTKYQYIIATIIAFDVVYIGYIVMSNHFTKNGRIFNIPIKSDSDYRITHDPSQSDKCATMFSSTSDNPISVD
jgi:hypothetical protein